jgi:Zn-dependent peptidase ImmA (M78 family)
MSKLVVRSLLSDHWDGHLPVDPFAFARGLGVMVHQDSDMGELLGRYEFVNGKGRIYTNPAVHERIQRFTVAHELGHHALHPQGNRFVDTERELDVRQRDIQERQANLFALELLIPGFVVEIVIMKWNITDVVKMAEQFAVPQDALVYKLQRLGWVPWKMDWERDWRRAQNAWEREQRSVESMFRRIERQCGAA